MIKEEKRKNEAVERNESMALAIVGLGCGMLVSNVIYFKQNVNPGLKPISMGVSSLLISTSSLFIHNYRKLDKKSEECSETVKRGYNISIVLLGLGIGVLINSLVSPEKGVNRLLTMTVLSGVMVIFAGSLGIHTRNKCKLLKEEKKRKKRASGWAIGIGIAMFVIPVAWKAWGAREARKQD